MHQLSFQLTTPAFTPIKNLLRQRLKDKNNLLYVASGRIVRNGYESLPYDNIVLVDKCFKEPVSIEGRITKIGLTALGVTSLFKEIGVHFKTLVNLNCGIREGGATYPIGSNWSLSNILPVMHDTYIHIACPGYHGNKMWKKKLFNLPNQATELNENESGYIDPKIFSDYYKTGKKFYVWKVTQKQGEPVWFDLGSRKIAVQRKNIWSDVDELDTLFVRCSPGEERNLKSVEPKAEILNDYNFEQILQYCNRNRIVHAGFMPWLRGNYNGFLSFLEKNEEKYPFPKQVTFYHLHHNDYKELYKQAATS